MKKRDVHIGLRVEIDGFPFKGRTGVVRGVSRFGFLPVWEIWCDYPDAFGRQLVRVQSRDIHPQKA